MIQNGLRAALIATASFLAGALIGHFVQGDKPADPPVDRDKELDREVVKSFFAKVIETSAGAIQRSRDSATFLQGASAAIAALYSGALGLVFVAGDNPLPARGLAATLFLGLAVVLAAAYIAFLTRSAGVVEPEFVSKDTSFTRMLAQASVFHQWTNNVVREREGFLRASVVSLGVGVALLPMAFVQIDDRFAQGLPWYAADAVTDPSPAELDWPDPEFTEPPEVAGILYQAQIDAFVEGLDAPPAADAAENAVTILLALVGAVAVVVTLLWGAIVNVVRWASTPLPD
jgi:hypothetical protein